MPFYPKIKEEALVRSRRCCCVCQEFTGLYTNVHHIIQEVDGGPDTLENAIVLCLRCHGEVGHYNLRHRIGNKYSPRELLRHRDEWWEWCQNNPAIPLPKFPITVSPGIVNLGSDQWRGRSTIKLHNKTDRVYYQVWVKIGFEQKDVPTNQIKIIPSESSLVSDLELRIAQASVNPDVIRIDCEDQTGSNAVFLQLYSLNPGSTFTFVVTNESPDIEREQERIRAFVTICGFEEEPGTVLQSKGKAAVSFKPPESIKARSVSLLVKKAT